MATDPFLAHEALDRVGVIADIWDTFVVGHPFAQGDPVLAAEALKIGEAIGEFYQRLGGLR